MIVEYAEFLATKRQIAPAVGVAIGDDLLHREMFEFQRAVTRWALRKGRAAIFAGTGLGKTLMQLVWASRAADRVLILAPLGVARQTVREGERWSVPVTYARSMAESPAQGITITNYEMVDHFDPAVFGAVVCDESSILKAMAGKTRAKLTELFADTPFRLCCTATPAPNDISEITNHAEFLGIMTRVETLASFFVHDGSVWRLKGHAYEPFYRWLASWAMSLNTPSDLGYSDDGYILPPLTVTPAVVDVDYRPEGRLFAVGLNGITERSTVRKATVDARVAVAASRIRIDVQPWIAWVGRNDEGHKLAARLSDAVLVEGSQSPDEKAARIEAFVRGDVRTLVTKSSIAGFGLNLQMCARQVFVGLSDSWESYYQAIRRSWRFGQARPVEVMVVISEPERPIFENVLRKEREAQAMATALVRYVADFEKAEIIGGRRLVYTPTAQVEVPAWLQSQA